MNGKEYVLVVDLPIAKKGTNFKLLCGFYTNSDESIVLRSTNYTGKIIKKTNENRNCPN